MLSRYLRLTLLVLITVVCHVAEAQSSFEFKKDDRVAFIGNTFTERAQQHGFLETLITARNHDKNLVFRNLGWSGDTVFGDARAYFGSREDGYKHQIKYLNEVKPTVVVLAYGSNAAFKGESGLPEFERGLERLIGDIKKLKARLVIVSPTPLENLGAPYPEPTEQNKNLARYTVALQEVARKHNATFVDLFNYLSSQSNETKLTYNGIHFDEFGYRVIAPIYAKALGVKLSPWALHINADGKINSAVGTAVKQITRSGDTGLKFALLDDHLPLPLTKDASEVSESRHIKVEGLPAGRYVLKIDGKEVAGGTAEQFAKGEVAFLGPEYQQAQDLRQKIIDKNTLYFHSYRPQNETYLRGFRKHEQGNNAVEIDQFKPIILKHEQAIYESAHPKVRQYEIAAVK